MIRALALALLSLLILAPASHAAWPGTDGPILFTSGGDLWNTGGRLTQTPEAEAQGTWSPDGRRIAFRLREGTAPYRVAVMNADGSGRVVIGGRPDRHETQPGWSPDGRRIVFRRSIPDQDASGDVWVMNADGSGAAPLIQSAEDERYPAFSPDGSAIVFTRGGDLWLAAPDGGGARAITSGAPVDSAPSWSSDGSRIAFERGPGQDSPDNEIWTVASGGGDERRLTDGGDRDEGPAYSPSGAYIAFTSGDGADARIHVMRSDGAQSGPLDTPVDAAQESPDWGPNQRGDEPPPPPEPPVLCACPGPPFTGPPPQVPRRVAARDLDTDDDGLSDARERRAGTSPLRRDTDRDGLHDGQELGIADAGRSTAPSRFRADLDPSSRTSPRRRDTDRDGLADGREDRNRNGRRDRRETDPRRRDTDRDGLSDRRDARPTTPRRGSSA